MAKTREWVQTYMSQAQFDASHDYSHVQRVLALCFQLLRVEQKASQDRKFDGLVVELVALMHDIDDHKYRHERREGVTVSHPTPASSNVGTHATEAHTMNPFAPLNQAPVEPVQHDTDPETPVSSSNPTAFPEMISQVVEDSLLEIGWPPYVTVKVAAIVPFISYTGT